MAALARASAWAALLWRMALNEAAAFGIAPTLERDALCKTLMEQRRATQNEGDVHDPEGRDNFAFPAERF